jgi:hypothetical protein
VCDVRDKQLADPAIGDVLRFLEAGADRPRWEAIANKSSGAKSLWSNWERLLVHEGKLYRKWESVDGKTINWQLVLPKCMRKEVFKQLHASRTAGHLGAGKVVPKVRQRFWWHHLKSDIENWCRQCEVCQRIKHPQRKGRAPMQRYTAGETMQRMAIYILGPLPVSSAGNRYILVASDYFTKWTEVFALPNQEASTIADVLARFMFCRFGIPTELHSDQGRNFSSKLFAEVCQLFGIRKTQTTAFHPQSDGMIERFNRTLEAMLRGYVASNQLDWDDHLPYLLMAYRASVHETTKYTPNYLFLSGRELSMPLDLQFGSPPGESPQLTTDYAIGLREKM